MLVDPVRRRRTCASGSKPSTSFVARTSSSPSGAPCALAVSVACGAGIGDVAAHDDQRRALASPPRPSRRRGLERVEVVDVGARAGRASRRPRTACPCPRVEGERGRAVDRDAVVVVEDDELAEPERAGERGGLLRDALHQVAVGRDHVHAVVDDLVPRPVVALRQEALGHAPCRRRCRRPARAARSWSRRPGVRKCSGWPGVRELPLAEPLELVEREVVAGQVQGRVLKDAGVSRGEHEAVAVRPVGVGRVRAQELAVDRVGERGERHRRARVPRVRLLDGVHRERRGSCRSRAGERPWSSRPRRNVTHASRLSTRRPERLA